MSLQLSWEPEKTAVEILQSPTKGKELIFQCPQDRKVGTLLLVGKLDKQTDRQRDKDTNRDKHTNTGRKEMQFFF